MTLILTKLSPNIFSGISLMLNFLLLMIINSKYGISLETDVYFFSIVLVTFISIFSQLIWEAVSKYYIDFETKNNIKSSYLYSSMLNINILFSIIVIFLYFIVTIFTNLIPIYFQNFLNIFIFYTLIQNIYIYNKYILNIKKQYSLFYILDIVIVLFNIITISIIASNDIKLLGIAYILSTSIVLFYQFLLIFYKYKIKYYFVFYIKYFKKVYINSFNLKIGQVLYLTKDIVISIYIQNMNVVGLYSLYTYAFKLVSLGFQVIQLPVFNRYVIELANLLKNKEIGDVINKMLHRYLFKTLLFIGLLYMVMYLFLADILVVLSKDITFEQIDITKGIFIFLSIGSLIYVLISFLERYLAFIGLYVDVLKIVLSFFIVLLFFYYFTDTKIIEYAIINLLIIPSSVYLFLVIILYFKLLKKGE